jgi:ribosomal protein S18 acetylase RimI-like enzyme
LNEGVLLKSFKVKDGRTVKLRTPQWRDLDDCLEFINSLIEERTFIVMNIKQTRSSEMDWLSHLLISIENKKVIGIAAEVDGKLVGMLEVNIKNGYESHVASLGISIMNGYRDVGIGQEMMREAENQSRLYGVEVLYLEVYANNPRARHVYEKAGYVVKGEIPRAIKREEGYIDAIIMVKHLL